MAPNNISNRLYACEDCNEKEKRDQNWRDFLRSKTESDHEYAQRERLIEQWMEMHSDVYVSMDGETKSRLAAEIDTVIASFDRTLEIVRSMRPNSNHQT